MAQLPQGRPDRLPSAPTEANLLIRERTGGAFGQATGARKRTGYRCTASGTAYGQRTT